MSPITKSGIAGQKDGWLFVRDALRERQLKGLSKRLLKAEDALKKLADRPGKDAVILEKKVTEILKRHRVADYLVGKIDSKIHYDKVYEGSGRPSATSPFRRVRQTTFSLTYYRSETEIEAFQAQAGWRLYVTNASSERLSLEKACLTILLAKVLQILLHEYYTFERTIDGLVNQKSCTDQPLTGSSSQLALPRCDRRGVSLGTRGARPHSDS